MTPMTTARISRQQARADTLTMIELYVLDMADGSSLRFTPSHPVSLGFGGETYHALPISARGFRWSGHGAAPRPVLEVANHGGLFSRQLDNPDMVGMNVIRMVTFATECDAPVGDGGGACFTPERWVIERIARLDEAGVMIELGAEVDLAHFNLPSRVMLADLCQHRYRRWDSQNQRFDYSDATCPYVGAASFDATGATTSSANDQCSLRLETGCKRRFSRQLPFLGFPGLG